MPKDPDPRPIICPLTAAGFRVDADPGTESPAWAETETEELEIELCAQDLDASLGAAPGLGDCNLDCCHCALRWYARRIVNLREN